MEQEKKSVEEWWTVAIIRSLGWGMYYLSLRSDHRPKIKDQM